MKKSYEARVGSVLARLIEKAAAGSGAKRKGIVMYGVIARLFTDNSDSGEEDEIRAELVRFCETEKEAADCDLGGDFSDADREVYDLSAEDELKSFIESVTPSTDYTSFFISDEDSEEE